MKNALIKKITPIKNQNPIFLSQIHLAMGLCLWGAVQGWGTQGAYWGRELARRSRYCECFSIDQVSGISFRDIKIHQ
jgi:hypothetical protein